MFRQLMSARCIVAMTATPGLIPTAQAAPERQDVLRGGEKPANQAACFVVPQA